MKPATRQTASAFQRRGSAPFCPCLPGVPSAGTPPLNRSGTGARTSPRRSGGEPPTLHGDVHAPGHRLPLTCPAAVVPLIGYPSTHRSLIAMTVVTGIWAAIAAAGHDRRLTEVWQSGLSRSGHAREHGRTDRGRRTDRPRPRRGPRPPGRRRRIVEQAPEPAAGSRGKGIQPRTHGGLRRPRRHRRDPRGRRRPTRRCGSGWAAAVGEAPHAQRPREPTDDGPVPDRADAPAVADRGDPARAPGRAGREGRVRQRADRLRAGRGRGDRQARHGTEPCAARYLVARGRRPQPGARPLGIGFAGETREDPSGCVADVRVERPRPGPLARLGPRPRQANGWRSARWPAPTTSRCAPR